MSSVKASRSAVRRNERSCSTRTITRKRGPPVDARTDRAARPVALPDPSRDPSRIVAVGATAATDLDEQVFRGANVIDARVGRALEQHQV